jgi:hypothetical protein
MGAHFPLRAALPYRAAVHTVGLLRKELCMTTSSIEPERDQ